MRIIADCYKKFNIKNTSVSANKNPHHIRTLQKHFLTSEQNRNCTNASLHFGTVAHQIVQKSFAENISIEEAIELIEKDPKVFTKLNNYTPHNEKDGMKAKFIIKFIKEICNNHLLNLKELPKQKWKVEQEMTTWLPNVNIYFRMFIDLAGETHLNDLKNKFVTVKYAPLKKTATKDNPHRMGDYVCSFPKFDTNKVFTTDLMQMALYFHSSGLKPTLSYATANDRMLFTEDYCEELKPKNLAEKLKELAAYEIAWEKKLKAADGSLEELMWLCPPDFSEIKKKTFWYQGIPQEYLDDYVNFYLNPKEQTI